MRSMPALTRDLERIEALWADGFARFGGPFLTGAQFCAADAFFAPVAFRFQTYELPLGAAARRYAAQLLALPSMQTWYHAALRRNLARCRARRRDAPRRNLARGPAGALARKFR